MKIKVWEERVGLKLNSKRKLPILQKISAQIQFSNCHQDSIKSNIFLTELKRFQSTRGEEEKNWLHLKLLMMCHQGHADMLTVTGEIKSKLSQMSSFFLFSHPLPSPSSSSLPCSMSITNLLIFFPLLPSKCFLSTTFSCHRRRVASCEWRL